MATKGKPALHSGSKSGTELDHAPMTSVKSRKTKKTSRGK